MVELAGAIGRGLSWGKVSVATAQLTKQLLDAMEKLPQPATADDALGAAWREFQELVLNGAEA